MAIRITDSRLKTQGRRRGGPEARLPGQTQGEALSSISAAGDADSRGARRRKCPVLNPSVNETRRRFAWILAIGK